MVINMPEKSKEQTSTREENAFIDTCEENLVRTVNEISKYQPQYAQSISNLHHDCLEVTKDLINRSFAIQKSWYRNIPYNTSPYTEQYRKQSDEIANQAFKVFDTGNSLALKMLDSAGESVKLYGKSIDTVTEFNANLVNTWSNFVTSAQKQFSG